MPASKIDHIERQTLKYKYYVIKIFLPHLEQLNFLASFRVFLLSSSGIATGT